MDRKLSTLYELCETVEKELELLNEKVRNSSNGLSSSEAEYLKILTTSLLNIKCAIEKMEESESNYSGAYYGENRSVANRSGRRGMTRGSMSYPNGRGNSRMSMDGAREDFIMQAEELMLKAPDEHTRMKYERFLNDLR